MLNINGLGDDIHSLPAMQAKQSEGYEIVIAGLNDTRAPRMFDREIFESIGCEVIDFEFTTNNERQWVAKALKEYGELYSMKRWCIEHDWDSKGFITKTRFQQFADFLDVKLPREFYWDFGQQGIPKREQIIFAPISSSIRRSYQYTDFIKDYPNVRILPEEKYNSFSEMVESIYNAKLVIAVDNGILAMALALGAPVIALFGATDENYIINQFKQYRDISNVTVIRSNKQDVCMRPCSFQLSRGWNVKGKCSDETYSDCMTEIKPEFFTNLITV